MSVAIVFVFGLILGSFLNVCIYRMPKDESIVTPPSHCPGCGKNIQWYDNIPVVSFIILMGKCRSCKAKISFRYPFVEMLTALLMTALFLKFGLHPKFFSYALMTSGLIAATFIDFEHQIIPDEVTIGGLVAGPAIALAFPAVMNESSRLWGVAQSLFGAAFGAASILFVALLGKFLFRKKLKDMKLDEAMGQGDIWLLAMIGSFLGLKLTFLTFFIAPFFGAIVGIILKMKDGRDIMPYGPYLSLAALVAVFFGENLMNLLSLYR